MTSQPAVTGAPRATAVRRLHWGCGATTPTGWINSDLVPREGVDLAGGILDGLPLADDSIDYVVSHHALCELGIYDQVPALRELRRVLRPGGILRLSLPDLDRAIAAYQRGDRDYFLVWDWDSLGGNFITQALWYNLIRTPFTGEFIAELLTKARFREVRPVTFGQTTSPWPAITALDGRREESLFVEAVV